MIARMLTTLAAITVIGNAALHAQQLGAQHFEVAKVGNLVRVQLTGDIASEFQTRMGVPESDLPPGLKITFDATIKKQLNNGRILVGQYWNINRTGEPARLLTLEADVEFNLTTNVIPKGSMAMTALENKYGSEFRRTTTETKGFVLVLSDRKGLKLRTWELDDELGD